MFQPIRVAVCGRKNAPPLFETLEVLGRETTLARIEQAIGRAGVLWRCGWAPVVVGGRGVWVCWPGAWRPLSAVGGRRWARVLGLCGLLPRRRGVVVALGAGCGRWPGVGRPGGVGGLGGGAGGWAWPSARGGAAVVCGGWGAGGRRGGWWGGWGGALCALAEKFRSARRRMGPAPRGGGGGGDFCCIRAALIFIYLQWILLPPTRRSLHTSQQSS